MHQRGQDRVWRFLQGQGIESARYDVARQHFTVRQCHAGQSAPSSGVGAELSEQLQSFNKQCLHTLLWQAGYHPVWVRLRPS